MGGGIGHGVLGEDQRRFQDSGHLSTFESTETKRQWTVVWAAERKVCQVRMRPFGGGKKGLLTRGGGRWACNKKKKVLKRWEENQGEKEAAGGGSLGHLFSEYWKCKRLPRPHF
jgi:hypothetical protein